MTTSSFPDGLSFSDLQGYLENAKTDSNECLYGGKTAAEVEAIAQRAMESTLEQCGDPIVHKVIALMILNRLGNWHCIMSENALDEGDKEAAAGFMADFGVLRSMHQQLLGIEVHEQDFTLNED